jgi:FMN phosphatase YigB (HAD superfamily)
MKQKIKLIIFDAYGPILSSGYPDTVLVLAKKFKIPKAKLHRVFYQKYFNLAAERKITQKQAWQKPIQELGLPIAWQAVRDLHLDLFKASQPALALVKKLRRDYVVVMLSKNTRSQFALTKKKFPLVWQSFDAVINTWELKLPKASKKTINEICRRFKVRPQEILYIDDQQTNLNQPKRMGVETIYYQSFNQLKRDLMKIL